MNRVMFWLFSYLFTGAGLLMLVLGDGDKYGRSGPFVVGGILLAAICQAWENLEKKQEER